MALPTLLAAFVVLGVSPAVSGATSAVSPLIAHQPRVTNGAPQEWTNLTPGNPNPAVLSLVTCPSTGACTAAGTEGSAAAVETATGLNAWSAPVAFHPPGTTATPIALSCADATDCEFIFSTTLTGKIYGPFTTWVATKAGRTWNAPVKVNELPAATGLGALTLTGISCPSPSNCVAVGTEATSATTVEPVEMALSAGTWQAPTLLPLPATSVSCTSLTSCSFVGIANDSSTDQLAAEAVEEVAGTTGPAKWMDLGMSTVDAQVSPLSCSSAGNCAAAGSTTTFLGSASGDQAGPGFIVTETDGTFRLLRSSDSYTAISCPPGRHLHHRRDRQPTGLRPCWVQLGQCRYLAR